MSIVLGLGRGLTIVKQRKGNLNLAYLYLEYTNGNTLCCGSLVALYGSP